MLKISDLDFKVKNAEIGQSITIDGITWHIDIEAEDKRLFNCNFSPHVYCEELELNINDWKNLENIKINWEKNYDEEKEISFAILYVFDHYDIYNSNLRIFNRKKNIFDLEWNAKCDIYFNEKYSTKLDLNIKTKINFSDVTILSKNEEKAIHLFSKYYNPDDFKLIESSQTGSDIYPYMTKFEPIKL